MQMHYDKNHRINKIAPMARLRPEDIIFRDKLKQRLANIREGKGGTKSDLSKNIEVDRQNFQPWEDKDAARGISIYSLNRVCKALGISLSDFFNDPIFDED